MCKITISKISAEIAQSLKTLILLDPANDSYKGGPISENASNLTASQIVASISLCLTDIIRLKNKDENDWKSIEGVLDISIPELMNIINKLGDKFRRIQAFDIVWKYLDEACKELEERKLRKQINMLIILFGAIYHR